MATSTQQAVFLESLLSARTVAAVDTILQKLPIVSPEQYSVDYHGPTAAWQPRKLHWMPVGGDRGNGGRIKLAGQPANPIVERTVNGMEAIIELERQRELRLNPSAPMPTSPRAAAQQYFHLPRLDDIPRIEDPIEAKKAQEALQRVRGKLNVVLTFDKKSREFAVSIRDFGIGQAPDRMHQTLLSLGHTDKADKPYMIGVFGQGGSSAFAAAKLSIIISRRAPELSAESSPSIGWTIVKQIIPKDRRDLYFAYLAASEDGAVPGFIGDVADACQFKYGSQFVHVGYNFGGSGSAVTRGLYQTLNHVLFNPILPYDLYTMKDKPDVMQGTAQRLTKRAMKSADALDRRFGSHKVA